MIQYSVALKLDYVMLNADMFSQGFLLSLYAHAMNTIWISTAATVVMSHEEPIAEGPEKASAAVTFNFEKTPLQQQRFYI